MPTYRLEYESDRFGVEKAIEFEASNASGALRIAKGEARGRWAKLYEDAAPLCRLERADPDTGNIWIVARMGEEQAG